MSVVSGNFRKLMKKLSFKNVHHNSGYKRLQENTRSSKELYTIYVGNSYIRGYIAIYVGEERKRYQIPIKVVNTEAFKALLDKYEDDFDQLEALAVPLCSIDDFKCVLRLAIAQTQA